MRRIVFLTLLLVQPAFGAFGPEQSNGDAGIPGEWLSSFSANARNAAMGNAGVGLKGAGAPYANPAGIAGLPMAEANMMVAPLLSAGHYQSLSLVYPVETSRQGWGMTILNMTSGDAEQTNNLGETVGSFKDQNTGALFSYARGLWFSFDAGVNVKYVRQSLAGAGDGGFGADLGIQREFKNVLDGDLTVGGAVLNLMSPSLQLENIEEAYSKVIRAGGAYKTAWAGHALTVAADVITIDASAGSGAQRFAAGIELEPFAGDFFPVFIRLGMSHRAYTAGLGILKSPISLNYAVEAHELDLLHRFGMSFRFGLLSPLAEKQLRGRIDELREKEVRLRKLKEDLERERRLAKKETGRESPAIAETPKTPPLEQARIYYENKEFKKALDLLKERKDEGGLDDRALSTIELLEARLLVEKGDYDKARGRLVEAVQYDPLNSEAEQLYQRINEIIEIESGTGE